MTAIPLDAQPQCPATVGVWWRDHVVEHRCERAAGHSGKHRATMHARRRGKPKGPWVKEWAPVSATWRCLLCGATGGDGLAGWQQHYDDEHRDGS